MHWIERDHVLSLGLLQTRRYEYAVSPVFFSHYGVSILSSLKLRKETFAIYGDDKYHGYNTIMEMTSHSVQ